MDASYDFVQFISETQFKDLPAQVIDVAKKSVLDTLGVGLAGSSAEEIFELYQLIEEWGGRQDSSVFVFGGRFPCPNVAFVNGAMCHAPESDDTYWEAGLHPSSVVVPSVFALSELLGGVDGKKFLTAQCVATEIGCRIGQATKYRRPEISVMSGWDNTSIVGYFMAAATARLIGLNAEKLHNALGIAYMQAAGNEQGMRDGALTKRMAAGFGARGGLTAAFMAQKGMTGPKQIFETGAASYYIVYHAGYDRNILMGGLGTDYLMTGIDIKAHHCCLILFAPIDATIKLIKENSIDPNEIEQIVVSTYPKGEVVCFPEEIKKQPRSIADAQFSIHWAIACAAVRGKANWSEFDEEARNDSGLLQMATKVKPIIDPSLDSMEHSVVNIKTRKGSFETKVTSPYGTTGNPMSYEDVANKFLDFAEHSAKRIPETNKKTVIEMVMNLEDIKDVTQIVRLLA